MANRPKSELREFLNAVKRTEKELLTLVMGSFLFSLLPAIARYKDVSFSAVVELLGGCMGAAGVLSAFFGSYVHPAEKYEVLDYRPIFPGLGVAVCISLSALCFYLFYSLSDYSNDLSLLFVAAGTFLFFYMLGRAVVVIERIEFQKAIWAGMTSEMRTRFYDRQAALEKLSNDLEKTVEQQRSGPDPVKEAKRDVKEAKKQDRRRRWKWRRASAARWFLRTRQRIAGDRLLTSREKLEKWMDEREFRIIAGFENDLVLQILDGENPTSVLEGTSLRVYRDGPWLFVVIDGKMDLNAAEDCATKLKALRESARRVFVIIAPSAQLTFDAEQALRSTHVEIIVPKPPKPGPNAAPES